MKHAPEEITQVFIDGLSDRQLKNIREDYPGLLSTSEALDAIQTAVECYIEDSLGKGRNLDYIDEIDELERAWRVIINQIATLNIRVKNERAQ